MPPTCGLGLFEQSPFLQLLEIGNEKIIKESENFNEPGLDRAKSRSGHKSVSASISYKYFQLAWVGV
jgi:hypothetical protein